LRATEGGVAISIINNNLYTDITQLVPSATRNLAHRNDKNPYYIILILQGANCKYISCILQIMIEKIE